MRTIRVEAPTEQTLHLYLYPFKDELAPDPAGYTLIETGPRQYEYEVEDPLLLGTYRAVIEVETEAITTVIDSGYIVLCQGDDIYEMKQSAPTTCTTTPSQESEAATLTDFGPKRVKTKEMEIEQFDPLRNQMAAERATLTYPGWCSGFDCVGRGVNEYPKPRS